MLLRLLRTVRKNQRAGKDQIGIGDIISAMAGFHDFGGLLCVPERLSGITACDIDHAFHCVQPEQFIIIGLCQFQSLSDIILRRVDVSHGKMDPGKDFKSVEQKDRDVILLRKIKRVSGAAKRLIHITHRHVTVSQELVIECHDLRVPEQFCIGQRFFQKLKRHTHISQMEIKCSQAMLEIRLALYVGFIPGLFCQRLDKLYDQSFRNTSQQEQRSIGKEKIRRYFLKMPVNDIQKLDRVVPIADPGHQTDRRNIIITCDRMGEGFDVLPLLFINLRKLPMRRQVVAVVKLTESLVQELPEQGMQPGHPAGI